MGWLVPKAIVVVVVVALLATICWVKMRIVLVTLCFEMLMMPMVHAMGAVCCV